VLVSGHVGFANIALQRPKLGIALGSGAARGWAHNLKQLTSVPAWATFALCSLASISVGTA
jgi:hypothetical protein